MTGSSSRCSLANRKSFHAACCPPPPIRRLRQASYRIRSFATLTIVTLYVALEQRSQPCAFLAWRKFKQAVSRIAVGIVEPSGRNDTRSLKLSER
jgi:hypothetical protein